MNDKIEYNDELHEAIVVDVDGTLAHLSGDPPRDIYDASKAMEDSLDDAVSSIVAMHYRHGFRVIIVTGRHSGHIQVTKDWLEKHGVEYDEIHCREEGDKRPDYEVKQEIFNNHIRDKYNVRFVIEDRPAVVSMYRNLGLKVLDVGEASNGL